MEWFESWFNTPYYHALYSCRNVDEASVFLHKLIPHLEIPKNSKILDIGCGKGRHSKIINQMGFDVVGFDLSVESIKEAKKLENEHLSFYVHDMRNLLFTNYFDYAFNLFTSFGYFENERGNIKTLKSVHAGLKMNGLLVIDFLNATKVIKNMKPQELKSAANIYFHIHKRIENNRIIKEISFSDQGKDHIYEEKVQLLSLADFQRILNLSGFKIKETFGSYNLDAFTEESDRLIILAEKLA
ncbi:MAG: class I SAM-dependent methyltransferase [Bacteroidetes bacterium]|nr:class I SAM-dependent methyltransferase [Bacteroidota bacterium]